MLIRRKKIIIGFIILGLLFSIHKIYSYNNTLTHPKLTEAIINFYNENTEKKITKEQIDWIIKGSIDEDDPVSRCINHFFDPISGKGLTDGKYKYIPGIPAPKWANSSLDQTIGIYKDDFSWQSAIYNYQEGNLKEAFISLGHVLHLLEDMGVPSHTRNDAHEKGDPYEKWVGENNNKIKVNTSNLERKNCNNNEECLKELAKYTNNNFFSKDTIFDNYEKPNTNNAKLKEGYLYVDDIKIIQYDVEKNKVSLDDVIHQSYWDNLSPKTVSYGAGLIELFFKEVEGEKQEKPKTAFSNLLEEMRNVVILTKNKLVNGWQSTNDNYEKIVDNYFKQEEQEKGKILAAEEKNNSSETNNLSKQEQGNNEVKLKVKNIVIPIQENQIQNKESYRKNNNEIKTKIKNEKSIGVARVIDGDTIELTTGEIVRYIGVDTPELGKQGSKDDECLAWVARLRNMQLISAGNLKLIKDPAVNKDKYGRLLRYVYTDKIFINKQLALDGLAEPFFCMSGWENCPVTSDNNRKQEILLASDLAKKNNRGLFSEVCKEEKIEEELAIENKNNALDNNLDLNNLGNVNSKSVVNKTPIFIFNSGGGSGSDSNLGSNKEQTEDTTSPVITFLETPEEFASSTSSYFSFSANEEIVNYQYKLNNENWQDCEASTTINNLVEGLHEIKINVVDNAGNIGSSTFLWIIDLTTPTSTINSLAEEYLETGFTVSWEGGDASSTIETSGLASFDIQYKIESGDWQDFINATTSTSTVFNISVNPDNNIYFRSRARDMAGNIGVWSNIVETKIDDNIADYLVISEINLGSNDLEWVELYNPTEEKIDLSIKEIYLTYFSSLKNWNEPYKPTVDKRKLTGNIQAKGFYLIKIDGEGSLSSYDYDWGYLGNANTLNDLNGSVAIFSFDPEAKTLEEAEEGKIDGVGWGNINYVKEGDSILNVNTGVSIERKAVSTSTAETMSTDGVHNKLGNSYDSDNNNNDFIIKSISNPQTLSSSREPRSQISEGLVNLWHFDECKDATSSDSIGFANFNNKDNKWEVGKWGCSIKQYVNYESVSTTFINNLDLNNFTISFYYKFPYDNSRPYFRFFNDSGDQLKMLFYPYYMEVWGLPHIISWRYGDIEWPYGNNWHQASLVINNDMNYWILYLDGDEFYRESMDYDMFNVDSFEINGDNNYNLIDEMGIWNRALGDEEIKDIFNKDLPLSPNTERDPQEVAQKINYWSFDEGFGTTTYDIIGNNDLEINNFLWEVNGYASSSIWQTYHSQYKINKYLNTEINYQDLSIDFWWKNGSSPNEGRGSIVFKSDSDKKMFGITPTYIDTYYYHNGDAFFAGGSIPNDSEWHHLALVYDSYLYQSSFYVDGIEKATSSLIWFKEPITKLEIYGENYKQEIDEITFWKGALSSAQVLDIYNQ